MKESQKINEILSPLVVEQRRERIERVLHHRTSSLTLVLEDLRNPHNISAAMRSADAFGITDIHLIGDAIELSSGISLGTERWMRMHRHTTAQNALDALRDDGFAIVALQPEEDTRIGNAKKLPITELPFEDRLALVFGNEHKGLSEILANAAMYHAFIPMYGFVESLNVSVACALTLFCSTIAATRPERRSPELTPEEKEQLRANWLQQSVRGAETILRELSLRERDTQK